VARGRNRALKTSAFYKKMSLFDYDYLDPSTYENFEELLEGQKVDPNECDENGMTPLHHIASQLFEMSSWILVYHSRFVAKILQPSLHQIFQVRCVLPCK
jgi:hypothetical protein